MKILSYNCRGLGSPKAVLSLRRLIRNYSPDMIFLMETKAYAYEMDRVKIKCSVAGCLAVPAAGRAGGLALIWKDDSSVEIKSYSNHHIEGMVEMEGRRIRITGCYGWPDSQDKKRTTDLIDFLGAQGGDNWIIFGDLNVVLFPNEKSGGNGFDFDVAAEMSRIMGKCDSVDLGFKGL